MQEKKNIGKTYEGTEEYVAFFVKGYYVLVQESSLCGLDYTIYDANFREIDGGVITDNETDDKLAFGCDMLAEIDSSIMFNCPYRVLNVCVSVYPLCIAPFRQNGAIHE